MLSIDVTEASDVMDPDVFLEKFRSSYDGSGIEGAIPFAHDFRKVANNTRALLKKLHNELCGMATRKFSQYSQSSILLAGERGPLPYLRVNVWPPGSEAAETSDQAKAYGYFQAHNHNFSFLTTGYFGPGYTTDVWRIEQDPRTLSVGALSELRWVGKHALSTDLVQAFESIRDVHVQYPPEELTLSINLMLFQRHEIYSPQYFFDAASGKVVSASKESPLERRASMLRIAGIVGDEETRELLAAIASHSRSDVLRNTAAKALYSNGC